MKLFVFEHILIIISRKSKLTPYVISDKLFCEKWRKGKHFPKRKPENFTLIELLVVIAVIAVLAGLLLPSLQKARETAKVIQCRNSIRNIGLAVLTYSQDYQGWFPAHWDGKRSKSWLDLLGQNEKDVTPYHNRKI